MRRVVLLILISYLSGCASSPNTKHEFRKSFHEELSRDKFLKDEEGLLLAQCYPHMQGPEVVYRFERSVDSCLDVVTDKMPERMTSESITAYAMEVDMCANIEYSRKMVNEVNQSAGPECVTLHSNLQILSNLTSSIDERNHIDIDTSIEPWKVK